MQDLHRFLLDKLKHGAVYQVGTAEHPPDMKYIGEMLQSRTMAGSSPPVKRKKVSVDIHHVQDVVANQLQYEDVPLHEVQVPQNTNTEEKDEPMIEGKDPFMQLLEAMTPESQVQMGKSSYSETPRPQRERKQTHLYQSDEVALPDKKVVKID